MMTLPDVELVCGACTVIDERAGYRVKDLRRCYGWSVLLMGMAPTGDGPLETWTRTSAITAFRV